MVLLRGAHQLAVANDLRDDELEARILMTYHEQWGEPATGLALAREGLEIGRRRGSRLYGSWMVGNGCICALRTGDWDWAAGLLEEWLALESANDRWAEFHVDRAILRSLRGEDATADLAEAARIRLEDGITDPQFEAYGLWAGAWAAFAGGRPDEVRRLGERAVELRASSPRSSARCSSAARSGPATPRGPPRPWPRWTPRATSARPSRPTAWSPGPGSTPWRGAARPPSPGTARPCALPQARARLRRGGGGRGHGRPPAVPGAGRRRRRDRDRGRPRNPRAPRRAPVPRPARRGSHGAAYR